MRSALLPFLIAVVSSALGFWLAAPGKVSEGFVLAAVAAWVVFARYLYRFDRRSRDDCDKAAASGAGVDEIRAAGFDDLVDAIERSLVVGPAGDRRRRVAAARMLVDGSPLVPTALRPGAWLSAGQAFLVSLGLFGTFVGLSLGLHDSIPYIDQNAEEHAALVSKMEAAADEDPETAAMQKGMSNLLAGARTAFSKSVAGIGLGLSYMLLWRLAHAAHRRRLEAVARRVDKLFPFVSTEELMLEQLGVVANEVRALREAQPDEASLALAGASLGRGAASLQEVAGKLAGVAGVLGEFRPDRFAAEIASGVRGAVDGSLAPTMSRIGDELAELRQITRQQDEAVARQLKALLEALREEALAPLASQLSATNEQTREVAQVVRQLGSTVAASSAAVADASVQMNQLTAQLTDFQKRALRELNDFALHLGESVDAQRVAFEASAVSATESFQAQTSALRSAGDVASDAIRQAGAEASATLVNVRTTFADALAAQQESLKGVLAELESSFRRDLAERARFEQLTKDAIARVEKLAAVTSVGDATLRQATVEATAALGRALADNAVQSAANREGLDDLRRTLAASLSAAAEAHRDFLKKEDSNLESVLGKLYGLVDEIARTTRAVQERANGGGIDARA